MPPHNSIKANSTFAVQRAVEEKMLSGNLSSSHVGCKKWNVLLQDVMRRQRGLKESKNKEKPFRWWIIINGIPHGPIYFTREICITTSIATLKLPVMGETWLIWIKRTSKVPGNSSIRLCAIELQLFLNQAPEKSTFWWCQSWMSATHGIVFLSRLICLVCWALFTAMISILISCLSCENVSLKLLS